MFSVGNKERSMGPTYLVHAASQGETDVKISLCSISLIEASKGLEAGRLLKTVMLR